MHLLLIPGEGKDSNEKWLEEIDRSLFRASDLFTESYRMGWRHWSQGGGTFDPRHELQQLQDYIPRLFIGSQYIVFAKSAGSVLFLQALANGAPKPVGAVFTGLPLPQTQTATKYDVFDVRALLMRYNALQVPTAIIQNETERFRRPDELRSSLAEWGVTSCEVVNGTDPGHSYSVDTVVHHVLAQAGRVMRR